MSYEERRFVRPPYFVTPRAYFENLGYKFADDVAFAEWFSGNVDKSREYAEAAAEAAAEAGRQAEAAETEKEAAAARALDAEAWAAGTRGGEAVTEEDPAHENNAAYYAAQMQQTAQQVAGRQAAMEGRLDAQDTEIAAIRQQTTNPFVVAASRAEMTDPTKGYVYTGDGTGADAGLMPGASYVIKNGELVMISMATDINLELSGVAADAGKTGETLEGLDTEIEKCSLTKSGFKPSLYTTEDGNYYFDITYSGYKKSAKYICFRERQKLRADYIELECHVTGILMRVIYFIYDGAAYTMLGSSKYGRKIKIGDGDYFTVNFKREDGGDLTQENLDAINDGGYTLKKAVKFFAVTDFTEPGGISATTGELSNADTFINCRSRATFAVDGDAEVEVVLEDDPNFEELRVVFYSDAGELLRRETFRKNKATFEMKDAKYFKISVGRSVSSLNSIKLKISSRNQIEKVKNPNIENQTLGTLAFCYPVTNGMSSGRLILPPNYSMSGDSVPLIVFVHGSGNMLTWDAVMGETVDGGQTLSYLPFLRYLTDEGFAVFDCFPWCTKSGIPLSARTHSPFILPLHIDAYLRGISYVCDRFNVDISRVSILCKSQGGHIGNWALTQSLFPFRCVCLFAPSNGVGTTGMFFNEKCREAIAACYEFDATPEELDAFVAYTPGEPWNRFVSKNRGRLVSLIPSTRGVTNGNINDIFTGMRTLGVDVPQWMLDAGLPERPTGAARITETATNRTYVKTSCIPAKWWVAADDDQVSCYGNYATHVWLQNGGSDSTFRLLPTGTGGHHAMDTDPNALKTSGVTALGVAYADIPLAYVEAVEFIRQKMGG